MPIHRLRKREQRRTTEDWGWKLHFLLSPTIEVVTHTQHVEMQSVSPSSYLEKPFAVQSTKGSKHCLNKRNLSFPRRKAALSLWVVSSWFVVAVAIDVVIVDNNDEPDEHDPNRSLEKGQWTQLSPHAINLRMWENHILKKQPDAERSLETEACGQFHTKLKSKSTTSTPV